ncbi:MAG: hypoxanthine phosphoribosyltransferase [Nitrospirae bacterium]|nr:hypoxanthine phosphoribosyltransferase [Nitrospirota bacterium]
MTRIFGKPLISQQEINRRIKDLGRRISEDYQDRDVVMIGVLKGAFAFFADLVRAIQVPVELDFLVVSSYQGSSKSTGRVKVISDLTVDIKGQDVIVVEDIVDSGLTLSFLKKKLLMRHPNSLRVCALLDKPERRTINVPIEYVGFTVPNKYVVGYGLDYQNRYRNLPYIAVLDQDGEQE